MRISDWSSDVCSSDLNYIVNAQGQRLTGYDATGTNIVPIKVPTGNISPQPTGSVDFTTNLDANSPVIPAAPVFDADDPSTYTHQQPMSVYDSLGNAHQFTQYFVKRADNGTRSEEHTSELQSLMAQIVCRLLLANKTQPNKIDTIPN